LEEWLKGVINGANWDCGISGFLGLGRLRLLNHEVGEIMPEVFHFTVKLVSSFMKSLTSTMRVNGSYMRVTK
jgi:hypothetical protein